MSPQPEVLFLIGSGRQRRSTSESLAGYLGEQLAARGLKSESQFVYRALKSEQETQHLLQSVASCGLLVLAAPLFVDSLPGSVVQAFELLAEYRHRNPPTRTQRMLAILNCGFPEAHQNQTALAICRQFALETWFEWMGGLALGGGPAVNGRALKDAGGMARHARESLELTAQAIAAGEHAPRKAVDLMAKPLSPAWLYTHMATLGWRRQAHRLGSDLDAKPFEETGD